MWGKVEELKKFQENNKHGKGVKRLIQSVMMKQSSGLLGILLTLIDYLEFEGAQVGKPTILSTESKLTLTQALPEKKMTKTQNHYNKKNKQTHTKKTPNHDKNPPKMTKHLIKYVTPQRS